MPCLAHALNVKINGIYYTLDTALKTAEVTNGKGSGYTEYSGSITIPSSIKSDEDYSVTSIGWAAFADCSSLREIYSKNPTPPAVESDVFYRVPTKFCRLHVPVGTKEDYASAETWGIFYILDDIDEEKEKEALRQRLETGDINGDGCTNADDVEIVVQHTFSSNPNNSELPEDEEDALRQRLRTGDIDGNGRTTVADVTKAVECALDN